MVAAREANWIFSVFHTFRGLYLGGLLFRSMRFRHARDVKGQLQRWLGRWGEWYSCLIRARLIWGIPLKLRMISAMGELDEGARHRLGLKTGLSPKRGAVYGPSSASFSWPGQVRVCTQICSESCRTHLIR